MIVVDSSVWIAFLRAQKTRHTDALRRADADGVVVLLDVVLLEVLQGATDQALAVRIEEALAQFPVVASLDPGLARTAARHYRTLRAVGITIRKTVDLIIGTWCIANDHALLHADRDFDPMARHLGLRIV